MTIGRIPSVEGGIQPTIFDAKADILTATAADTPARLAVGNNGEQLLADSSATTGLRWQGDYAAGKNKVINGDFYVNQRGFSSETTNAVYTFDRWRTGTGTGGTITFTPQTFTPGTAPVSGYEGKNYLRIVTSGQTGTAGRAVIQQPIEDVRTLAGQTATVSFWAKANSGTPNINVEFAQVFGSGGSTTVTGIKTTVQTITTSWARYSFTISIPSVSGKTIGDGSGLWPTIVVSSGSDFDARYGVIGNQNNTFEIWGVQVEAGSVATAFQTATGTIQGELAACQRYFIGLSSTENVYTNFAVGVYGTTTIAQVMVPLPVTMRVKPSISVGTVGNYTVDGVAANVCSNLVAGQLGNQMIGLSATTGASTTGYGCYLRASNTTSALIQISAEL